jgi:hypothetical protein
MRARKLIPTVVICLFLGSIATLSLAQQAPAEFPAAGAGANLVVTAVSGPATAILNQTISVTYTVKNLGDAASSPYAVGLYLSANKTITPATDRLLKSVTFAAGLAPGVSKRTTTKVLVPINGLSGNYYYGAVVASSRKASAKQVAIVRYTADDNDTVTDHKTGLVWQTTDDGQWRDFADASQYCTDLVLGANANWRLPELEELQTIVDYSRYAYAIDPLFTCNSNTYWSGTTHAHFPANAWFVNFGDGYVNSTNKSSYEAVRCVRGVPW